MPSCREITALVSKKLDKKLNLRERFAVWPHLMICPGCYNFQKQTQFMRKAARRYTDELQNRLGKKS